jgi:hypothetical protein
VKNKRASTKARIAALEAMARPSIRFLSMIASDEGNKPRLRMLAVQLLEVRIQLRRAMKKVVPKEKHDREQSNKDVGSGAGQSVERAGT